MSKKISKIIQITDIIHISDIHIRSGNDAHESRYNEYLNVYNELTNQIKKMSIRKESTIICLCGDIFDNKGRLTTYAVSLFNKLIINLSELCKGVYLIHGNHDINQSSSEMPDLISSLLSLNKLSNVEYLDKTNLYQISNLEIGVVSCKDTLRSGNTYGQVDNKDLPEWPVGSPNKTKIALFHGTVNKSKLQNGKETQGYPLEWITRAGYDMILLGDIHLQQIYNINEDGSFIEGRTPWMYSSSLIQQNFGESIYNHGFIHVNLIEKKATKYHVYNRYGMLYMRHKIRWESLINNKWESTAEAMKDPKMPEILNIRIKGTTDPKELEKLYKILKSNKKEYKITHEIFEDEQDKQDKQEEGNQEIDTSIDNMCDKNKIIEYLGENKEIDPKKASLWLTKMESLMIKQDEVPESVISSLKERNKKIEQLINIYQNNETEQKIIKHEQLNLIKLEWSWLISYGKDNWINFEQMGNKITVIDGPNGVGKTSFMEIVCLSLFSKSMESRHNREYRNGIINYQKPKNEVSKTKLEFKLGKRAYIIEREYSDEKKSKKSKKMPSLYEYENNKIKKIKEGPVAVDKWVEYNIGNIDTFLLTCMVTQNQDQDFFSLTKKSQIDHLDNSLNLEQIKRIENIFKETYLEYEYIGKQIMLIYTHLTNQDKGYEEEQVNKLIEKNKSLKSELEETLEKKLELGNQLNMIDNYQKIKTDKISTKGASNKLSKINKELTKFDIIKFDTTIDELLQKKGEYQHKLQELNEYKSSDTNKKTEEELEAGLLNLTKNMINKPNLDPNILRRKKELFDKEYKNYQEYDASNLIEINNQIEKIKTKKSELIEDAKPKPNYDANKYKIWKEDKEKFEKDNKIKWESYKIPDLEINKEPSISREQIEKLKVQLETELNRIKNKKILDMDIEKIRLIYDKLEIEINKNKILQQKLENINQKLSEINKDSQLKIDNYEMPQTELNRIDEWMNKYKILTDEYPIYQKLNEITKDLNHKNKELGIIKKYISETEVKNKELPYNPECWACQKQPHRCYINEQKNKGTNIENLIQIINKTINQIITENNISENIDIGKWLDEYKTIKQEYNYYKTQGELWSKYKEIKPIKDQIEALNKERDSLYIKYENSEKNHEQYQDVKYCLENKNRWNEQSEFIKEQEDILNKYELIQKHNDLNQRVKKYNEEEIIWDNSKRESDEYMRWKELKDKYEKKKKILENNRSKIEKYLKGKFEISENDVLLEEYNKWEAQDKIYKNITADLYILELNKIEGTIKTIKRCSELESEQKYYKNLLEVKPKIEKINVLDNLYDNLLNEYNNTKTEIKIYEIRKKEYDKKMKNLEDINKKYQNLKSKQCEIEKIYEKMQGYKEWLYQKKILPNILKNVNGIANMIENCQEYKLEAEIMNGNILWLMNDGSNKCEIMKAGGFIKFILSLCLRLVLSYIGGTSVLCRQLFIDEGFVYSDKKNLSNTPEFLRSLICKRLYETIIIVTHLEILKESSDISISIKRENKISSIQYGNVEQKRLKNPGRPKILVRGKNNKNPIIEKKI